jgi:site-specific recombinase XerD
MAVAGADPWVIQQIMGHGSLTTTQRYVRAADLSRQDDAVAAFGGGAES